MNDKISKLYAIKSWIYSNNPDLVNDRPLNLFHVLKAARMSGLREEGEQLANIREDYITGMLTTKRENGGYRWEGNYLEEQPQDLIDFLYQKFVEDYDEKIKELEQKLEEKQQEVERLQDLLDYTIEFYKDYTSYLEDQL